MLKKNLLFFIENPINPLAFIMYYDAIFYKNLKTCILDLPNSSFSKNINQDDENL